MPSSDQNLSQCKDEAHLSANNLEDAHRKLENCLLQDKRKDDVIKDLQSQLQKLQKESSETEEERKNNRYPGPHPQPQPQSQDHRLATAQKGDREMAGPRVGSSPPPITPDPEALPVATLL